MRADARGLAAHDPCEACQLGDRLAFHSKTRQKRSDLRIGALTGHYLLKHRLGIPGTRPKQQRGASTPQHGVVQLFAARPLRRLAGHDLGVCARAGADIGPGLEQ